MHFRVVLILLALAGFIFLLRWFMRTPAAAISRMIKQTVIILAVGVLLYLAASGRLHWLFALFASLLPFARRLIGLLRYLPLLQRFFKQYQSARSQGNHHRAPGKANMSREEALKILGLRQGADKQAIIQAHRRLIQKLHPDRGGTDYLASQLNMAKKVLLDEPANKT